jgi:hypothetical protein
MRLSNDLKVWCYRTFQECMLNSLYNMFFFSLVNLQNLKEIPNMPSASDGTFDKWFRVHRLLILNKSLLY